MAALVEMTPTVPVANGSVTVTMTGGTDVRNRLLLDGAVIATTCSAEDWTTGATVGTEASQVFSWEQLVAGVWTEVDDLAFDIAASGGAHAPRVVTTNTQTIEDEEFTAAFGDGIAIWAHGTDGTAPITDLIIRRCTFTGFNWAILLEYVDTFTIEDCTFNGQKYASIYVNSGLHGLIQRNSISQIGWQVYPPEDVNAYGIALTRVANGNLTTDPATEDVEVAFNTVTDIPTWECIDTHAGVDLNIHDNICARAFHPIVIGPDGDGNLATDVIVDSNQVLQARGLGWGVPPGSNIQAITIRDVHAGTAITDNEISVTYPLATDFGAGPTRVYDYLGASSGETVTGNTDVP